MPAVLFRIDLDHRAAQPGVLWLALCLYTLAFCLLHLPFTEGFCLYVCLPLALCSYATRLTET